MAITSADIQTKIEEAVTAQESGDFATAITKLRSAKMMLAGLPNISTGDVNTGWDRASIDNMISALEREQSAADAASTNGPFKNSKIIYENPDS